MATLPVSSQDVQGTKAKLRYAGLKFLDLGPGIEVEGYGEQFHLFKGVETDPRIWLISKSEAELKTAAKLFEEQRDLNCNETSPVAVERRYAAIMTEVLGLLGAPRCCAGVIASVFFDHPYDLLSYSAARTIGRNEAKGTIDVHVPYSMNLAMTSIGIYALPFWPCDFNCENARSVASSYLKIYEGMDPDVALSIRKFLSIPAQYSLLHGIAQLVTPILRSTYHSLGAYYKITVNFHIEDPILRYDEIEGATKGVSFPFKTSRRVNLIARQNKTR